MSSTAFIAICCILIVGYADAMCQFESDGTFLPDPSSRQRFIYCSGGQMIPGYCTPGEEFDPFDRVCEVPRWNPQPVPTTTSTPRDVCFNRPDGVSSIRRQLSKSLIDFKTVNGP